MSPLNFTGTADGTSRAVNSVVFLFNSSFSLVVSRLTEQQAIKSLDHLTDIRW